MRRDLLAEAFGDNQRLIAGFEEQAEIVEATAGQAATAVEATEALDAATVLVLSPNAAFSNERVVLAGAGISLIDSGSTVTIQVSALVPKIDGSGKATFYTTADSTLLLPVTGTLATLAGSETLSNKHVVKPLVSSWGNYANDAAASAAGVPVGGVYRNGSALMVRVA